MTQRHHAMTAAELVKSTAPRDLRLLNLAHLRSYFADKGYDLRQIELMSESGHFGRLFGDLVLRTQNIDHDQLNQYASAVGHLDPARTKKYIGSGDQNSRVDAAIANSGIAQGTVRFGEGSASTFTTNAVIPRHIHATPIAIVGYGAAGIMAAYALRSLGFTNITIYERSKALGIWDHKNVYEQSRNNPLRLQFFASVLNPAPGDGNEVRHFLQTLVSRTPTITHVTGIRPGNLEQRIMLADGTVREYPIVINTLGLGKPLPPSDPARMVTGTGLRSSGIRWQTKLDREKARAGLRIIMIGLGNSTAEMLRQIHTAIDDGLPIVYHVLTHYPAESVQNPSEYVSHEGTMYRVFRDISKPNLVDYQGDLALSRYDYFRALNDGRIIASVRQWEVFEPGVMTIYRTTVKKRLLIPFDTQMTLIGYRQPAETMQNFGCVWDDTSKCGIFDYDGEVAARAGVANPEKRLHKGYFGFGSVLTAPKNQNAIVIPGMLHRIGDLLFGVVMRAHEYYDKQAYRR